MKEQWYDVMIETERAVYFCTLLSSGYKKAKEEVIKYYTERVGTTEDILKIKASKVKEI